MAKQEGRDPFIDLRRSLDNISLENHQVSRATTTLRADPNRIFRTGVPEIILAEHKSDDDVVSAVSAMTEQNGRVLVSRCRLETVDRIVDVFSKGYVVDVRHEADTVVISTEASDPPVSGGRVGILAAGLSDRPCAVEASVMVEFMGVEWRLELDVGVAGLHRLAAPLTNLTQWEADAIIVAAGMDGALPSVVAGLVDVPVIGLPTSVGYGYGGHGEAALMSMLQTCAPGLAVVNIDNGIGAGAIAGLIANRAANARRSNRSSSSSSDLPRRTKRSKVT